jgi:hypothetical protein
MPGSHNLPAAVPPSCCCPTQGGLAPPAAPSGHLSLHLYPRPLGRAGGGCGTGCPPCHALLFALIHALMHWTCASWTAAQHRATVSLPERGFHLMPASPAPHWLCLTLPSPWLWLQPGSLPLCVSQAMCLLLAQSVKVEPRTYFPHSKKYLQARCRMAAEGNRLRSKTKDCTRQCRHFTGSPEVQTAGVGTSCTCPRLAGRGFDTRPCVDGCAVCLHRRSVGCQDSSRG